VISRICDMFGFTIARAFNSSRQSEGCRIRLSNIIIGIEANPTHSHEITSVNLYLLPRYMRSPVSMFSSKGGHTSKRTRGSLALWPKGNFNSQKMLWSGSFEVWTVYQVRRYNLQYDFTTIEVPLSLPWNVGYKACKHAVSEKKNLRAKILRWNQYIATQVIRNWHWN